MKKGGRDGCKRRIRRRARGRVCACRIVASCLILVSRACHEKSTRSIDTCAIAHIKQKYSLTFWNTYILFSFSFARPLPSPFSFSLYLPHAQTHTYHRIHCRIYTHVSESTQSELPPFFVTVAMCLSNSCRPSNRLSSLWTTIVAAIHASFRCGLPRLFKFPLTVRSAHRRTPAATHTAPRNTSLLLAQKPRNLIACSRCLFQPRRDVTD